MSLETRVEILEHELKILKNEIERTLLEIQNQVLVHYYPSLRAEDSAPPKDLLPLLESAFAEEEDEPETKMANRDTEANEMPAIGPKTKEISLTEVKQKRGPTLTPREMSVAKVVAPAKAVVSLANPKTSLWPEEVIDQALLPALAKWVNESVEKIGKELTQNMVESSANAEQITPAVMNLLLQFVTLCDEDHPPAEVTTKELMDVLLKLDKLLSQVSRLLENATPRNEAHDG